MRDIEELMTLIEKELEDAVGNLWDALTPEERRRVFNSLIIEWLSSNY